MGKQIASTPPWMASIPSERRVQCVVDLVHSSGSRNFSQTANRPAIDDTREAPRRGQRNGVDAAEATA